MKQPAFLFYSKDWIVGTLGMDHHVKGVYIDLLALQHHKQSLTADTVQLARMLGISHDDFLKAWDVLKDKFVLVDGKLYNQFLDDVISTNAKKAWTNAIVATYGYQLKKLAPEDREKLKGRFNVSTFLSESSETISEAIAKWIASILASAGADIANANANGNTVLNTDKEGPISKTPRQYLEDENSIDVEQMLMKSGLKPDEADFAFTQWSLACQSGGWEYSTDRKKNITMLTAGLQKWLNTWSRKDQAKEYREKTQEKPTFQRIIKQND